MARFLVVDDDLSTVHAMTRLLRDDGHEVSSFTQGAHAVDALSREPFDAIITDHEMPHVGGEDVVRAARRHTPGACLFVVSASPDADLLHDAGACTVHAKPLDYEVVVNAIG